MNLSFQFSTLSDFFMMSGHGPYVWAAYGITFAGLILLTVQGRLKRKQVITKINTIALRSKKAAS